MYGTFQKLGDNELKDGRIKWVECYKCAGFHTGFSVWGGRCCVWNRLSDENLTHLMRIVIEGPDLNEVNFNEILDIFKEIGASHCNWYIILL